MEKKPRQKLFTDGKRKECGIYHKIKMHSEFSKRQGRLRSICEHCRNTLSLIKNFKKKLRIIIENYNGKCSNCDIDIEKLPSLEFHHPNPKSKSFSWKSLRVRNYDQTIDLLNKDNVVILCKNCHILIKAIIFQEFKSLILKPSLFLNKPEEIEKMIDISLNNSWFIKTKVKQVKYYKSKAKYIIKKWIEKRYIVEKLFNNSCIGCQKITTEINLPSLGFHHILPSKKNTVKKWDKISKYSIKKIVSLLMDEKCICLCSNCHSMIHSKTFISSINDIFANKYQSLIHQIKSDYNKILSNIKNYNTEKYIRDVSIKEIFSVRDN